MSVLLFTATTEIASRAEGSERDRVTDRNSENEREEPSNGEREREGPKKNLRDRVM